VNALFRMTYSQWIIVVFAKLSNYIYSVSLSFNTIICFLFILLRGDETDTLYAQINVMEAI